MSQLERASPPLQSAWPVQGSELPGSAGAPFRARWLQWADAQGRGTWHQPWLNMAFTVIILYRCWRLLTPPTAAWLAASLALSLADVAWWQTAPQSYLKWRELPAALLRVNAFGPGAAWLLMRQLLDDHGGPAHLPASASVGGSGSGSEDMQAQAAAAGAVGSQMGAHLARLLFASGAAKMAANALSLRTRLSLSAAVQLALVLAAGRHTRDLCSAAPLASPAAQRMTHQLHSLLSAMSGSAVALPGGRSAGGRGRAGPSPTDECAAVVTWLRICLALLFPLLHEAASEARLWSVHQAQRGRAGLPAERCGRLQAAVYLAAGWLSWVFGSGSVEDGVDMAGGGDAAGLGPGGGGLQMALVVWPLLAVSWEWCTSILRL